MRSATAVAARLGAAALALGLSGCITIHLFGAPRQPLVESVVLGQRGPKLVLIDVQGVIGELPARSPLGLTQREGLVARVREQLDTARRDPEVRGLLLRINSPGGTATASDILFREIVRFKREREVPVVAQLMGMATSGGYYVAMSADAVVAYPTTITGSIGVIFTSVNLAGLMEKIGVEDQTITAGRHKDAGSPLRRMTGEERRHIQRVLDDLHARFVEVVASGRPALAPDALRALSDGRIFSAREAREAGLVDRIGDLEDAVEELERRAGISESRVVTYHHSREWKSNIYSRAAETPSLEQGLLSLLGELRHSGFFYLWWPAAR